MHLYFLWSLAASVFADVLEHTLRYTRAGYRWPADLPVGGVLIATATRALLALGGTAILGGAVGVVCNAGGAAIVGFALPQFIEMVFGRATGWGQSPAMGPSGPQD